MTKKYASTKPTVTIPTQGTSYASVAPTLPETTKTNAYETSLLKKVNDKQYYTYRCVGVYGANRITVDNSYSMSDASDSVWRRCQALKSNDETCKITDCYKLIK